MRGRIAKKIFCFSLFKISTGSKKLRRRRKALVRHFRKEAMKWGPGELASVEARLRWFVTPSSFYRDRKGKFLSPVEMARLFETPEGQKERIIGNYEGHEFMVSTINLVIAHPCWCAGLECDKTVQFETMILGEHEYSGYQWRWHSMKAAIDGHARAVALAEGKLDPDDVYERKDAG